MPGLITCARAQGNVPTADSLPKWEKKEQELQQILQKYEPFQTSVQLESAIESLAQLIDYQQEEILEDLDHRNDEFDRKSIYPALICINNLEQESQLENFGLSNILLASWYDSPSI